MVRQSAYERGAVLGTVCDGDLMLVLMMKLKLKLNCYSLYVYV